MNDEICVICGDRIEKTSYIQYTRNTKVHAVCFQKKQKEIKK